MGESVLFDECGGCSANGLAHAAYLRQIASQGYVIVALGTGKTNDDGKKVPFEVKKGDRVLVSKYGGTEIKLDGKEYKIFGSDDLLAIID